MRTETGSWSRSAVAVAVRPWLWRSALRFVPDRPWRRSSWRALRPYIEFRMATAFASPAAKPSAKETVEFLTWCRRFPRSARR